MTQYRTKPATVEASQWFKNGDHPLDYVGIKEYPDFEGSTSTCASISRYSAEQRRAMDWEGEVVRRFRHPTIPGTMVCACGATMHVHGWIDAFPDPPTVCPGDWIVTDGGGGICPVKPDIFAATYELMPAKQTVGGKIWDCKIGEAEDALVPDGADLFMRNAVHNAYRTVTGVEAKFIFSGWGGGLDEAERNTVERK